MKQTFKSIQAAPSQTALISHSASDKINNPPPCPPLLSAVLIEYHKTIAEIVGQRAVG